jgi:hypothetical protein
LISLLARTDRPTLGPIVTGVLHRSGIFSLFIALFREIEVEVEGILPRGIIGDGVRCFSRDFTYSDSNWKSSLGSEGGSSFNDDDNAADRACSAVIASPTHHGMLKDKTAVMLETVVVDGRL